MSIPRLSILLLSCYLLSFFAVSNAQNPSSYDFVIGDFNNDGRDDYIRKKTGDWATNDAQGNAELFLAQEDGQFTGSTLPKEFDIRTDNVNLYVGDFNGDGIDDILRQETGDWAPDHVSTAYLLLADGTGNFNKNVLSENLRLGGDEVAKLWIADFNGDGKDDILRLEQDIDRPEVGISSPGITNILIAVDYQSEFFVAINPSPAIPLSSLTPQGTFASRQVSGFVGQFSGDNYADVIRFESITGMAYQGSIFFTSVYGGYFDEVNTSNQLGYGGYFHIGDYNGDGIDEFVQSSSFMDGNQLFISNGGYGSFDAIQLSADLKLDTDGVLVGDFNGDGNSDIFSPSDTVQVYLSTGSDFDIIDNPFSSQGNGSVFYLGDFNADNKTDVLEYTGGEDGSVVIHLSNGDGTFS